MGGAADRVGGLDDLAVGVVEGARCAPAGGRDDGGEVGQRIPLAVLIGVDLAVLAPGRHRHRRGGQVDSELKVTTWVSDLALGVVGVGGDRAVRVGGRGHQPGMAGEP